VIDSYAVVMAVGCKAACGDVEPVGGNERLSLDCMILLESWFDGNERVSMKEDGERDGIWIEDEGLFCGGWVLMRIVRVWCAWVLGWCVRRVRLVAIDRI